MLEIVEPRLTMDEATHTYRWDGQRVRSVTQIISEIMGKPFYPPGDYKTRGKFVHLACHYFDQNRLDTKTLDPKLIPYFDGWVKFRLETGFEPILSEQPLYSPLGFAGTPDKFGIIGKQLVLPDIKTGGWGSNADLQLGGYFTLLRAQPQIAKLLKGKSVTMMEVRLPGDGTYKMKEHPEDGQTAAFQSFVNSLNWKYR